MSVEIKVPSLGESVSEATIAKWHKSVGDAVKMDELLVELETDKVTLEVSAPANGVISVISHAEGDAVKVGDVLGGITEGAVSLSSSQITAVVESVKKMSNQQHKPLYHLLLRQQK